MIRTLARATAVVLSLLMVAPIEPSVAEAGAACRLAAYVSLYPGRVVLGDGHYSHACVGPHRFVTLRVKSRNGAGDVSRLWGMQCMVGQGHIGCRSLRYACKGSLMYRTRTRAYDQGAILATDFSAWRRLC
jgi:hypothetical protein